MAITNISNVSSYSSNLLQKQQNMNNMFSALKSGDIASAQKCYASSGLPPMGANNSSPLGRLYQALRKEDLAGAQQAALDMQSKVSAKLTPQTATGDTTAPNTNNVSPAQKAASMLANAKITAQQSSVFAMLGVGGNSDSTNSSNQLPGLMAMLGNTVDTSV